MKSIISIAAFVLIVSVLIRVLLTLDAVIALENLVAALEMVRDGVTIVGLVAILVVAVIAIRDNR